MRRTLQQRIGVPALVGLLVVATGAPARAMFPPPPAPPESAAAKEVEALNNAAVEKFQAKQYDDAARLFEEAYNISPEPNYLFNIGRVFEEKGDLRQAVEYYERFMNEPAVKLEAREIALERVRVLKEIIRENDAKEADKVAALEAAKAEEEPEPLADADERAPAPPIRIAGIVLLTVGGVAILAGAGFGGAAAGNSNDLDELNTLETRDDAIKKGRRNAIIADSLFIAGGALALTGLVMTIVSYTKRGNKSGSDSKRASITPSFSHRGGGVTARYRF